MEASGTSFGLAEKLSDHGYQALVPESRSVSLTSDHANDNDKKQQNSLYWTLDVSFGEDTSRKREENAAENYSQILRIALNLLKNDGNKKRSLKGKRLDAVWNSDYPFSLLKN